MVFAHNNLHIITDVWLTILIKMAPRVMRNLVSAIVSLKNGVAVANSNPTDACKN